MARILVVDDDLRTGEFVRMHLQAAGHECHVMDSGEKALEAAKAGKADLLVLDVMMPGGTSGFEMCRRLRSDAATFTLPILMLSAMSGEEEIYHGLAQGADDYVAKPFDMQNLIHRIEQLLRANSDVKSLDETTSLPGAAAIKREVQKRVSRHEPFALACTELVRLREFSYVCGAEARQKAIRHLSRALSLCGVGLKDEAFVVAHMGGGYFACLLTVDNMERYANWVVATWNAHLPALYDAIGMTSQFEEAKAHLSREGTIPILGTLMCLTALNLKEEVNAKDLFDVVMRIRNKALAAGIDGIYYNRRS